MLPRPKGGDLLIALPPMIATMPNYTPVTNTATAVIVPSLVFN